jgi:hypothetical protein
MGSQNFEHRNIHVGQGYSLDIGLTGDVGYIDITDNQLYPDNDDRAKRRELGYNRMMIPLMTRKDLKRLKVAIKEVLKNSK